MSAETSTWLNTKTLIGDVVERGHAWHYRAESQGEENNHYDGAIPVGDVQRRLFNWDAVSLEVANYWPATIETMTSLDSQGRPVRLVVDEGRQAIAHPHTGKVFGYFKEGFRIHQYREWLLGEVSNILGDTLHISSAGLLADGGRAWVEVGVPKTITTPEGVAFRPNLLAATSLDGSLSTTYKRTINATVCDNTLSANLAGAGEQLKFRHSKYSVLKIADAREALNLVHGLAEKFETAVRDLCATTVTDTAWDKFLTELDPIDPGTSKRTAANIAARHDVLRHLWTSDERVAPWRGTAWGVVQAVNTYAHHHADVRGDRGERNMTKALDGEFDKLDMNTVNTLNRVLVAAR